jgi:exopolyphosphatase/pppGpp-phosphohydrolase
MTTSRAKSNLLLNPAWILLFLTKTFAFVSINTLLEKKTNEIFTNHFPPSRKECDQLSGISEDSKPINTIATMDVGSTGTRILVMRIDEKGNPTELFRGKFNTEFHINEGNMDMRLAHFIALSEWLTEEFGLMYKIAKATAGFRQAGPLGEELAQKIRDYTDIQFEIIDQKTEALLAYEGVQKRTSNSQKTIIDIGGGSGQIIIQQPDNNILIITSPCGSNIFLNQFIHDIKKDLTLKHLFPTTPEDVALGVAIAKKCLRAETTLPSNELNPERWNIIKDHIRSEDGSIRGIGFFHSHGVVAHIDKQKKGYTLEDLRQCIKTLCPLSLEEARQRINAEDPRHHWVISDLILALALMELLEIKYVHLEQNGNLEGIFFDFLQKKACNVPEIL